MEARAIGGYEIVAQLGAGAMGTVYRVRDRVGRELGMKVLPRGSSPEIIHRFQREARALARLDGHPGVVRVHAAGEDQGVAFYVMDIVAGQDLRTAVTQEGTFPVERAVRVAEALARAVHFAHEHGILHRDIKPQNVILGPRGPVLVDFGLAQDALSQPGLTRSGDIIGTPSYMPPEQAVGEHDRVGPASDVYGVGATLYAMLAGRPPFVASSTASSVADLVPQIVHSPPLPIGRSDVPPPLLAIIDRTLAKDPEDRYPSAAALADDLARFLGGGPVEAAKGRRRKSRGATLARARGPFAVLAVFLLAVLAGAGIVWFAVDPGGVAPTAPGDAAAAASAAAGPAAAEPPAARPLDLLAAGDAEAARAEALRRLAAGTGSDEDRIVLAHAAIIAHDFDAAVAAIPEGPESPELEIAGVMVRSIRDEHLNDGVDAIHRLAHRSEGLAHEALAVLNGFAGRPGMAADDLGLARREGGLAARLAEVVGPYVPARPGVSYPDPGPRPHLRDLREDDALRTAIEASLFLSQMGDREAARETLLRALGGEIPADAPAPVFSAMAASGGMAAFAWDWAAAARDPIFLVYVASHVNEGTDEWVRQTVPDLPPFVPGTGITPEDYRGVHAVYAYYRNRNEASFATLGRAASDLDQAVRERPWSMAPRLYRGIVALTLDYPRTGRADIEAAFAMAEGPWERSAACLPAAEGLARIDDAWARTLLDEFRHSIETINDHHPFAVAITDPYEIGNLRYLRPR